MLKPGANVKDQNAIRKLMKAGKTVKQISKELQIEEKCVKSFVEHFKGKK